MSKDRAKINVAVDTLDVDNVVTEQNNKDNIKQTKAERQNQIVVKSAVLSSIISVQIKIEIHKTIIPQNKKLS